MREEAFWDRHPSYYVGIATAVKDGSIWAGLRFEFFFFFLDGKKEESHPPVAQPI